MQLDGSRAYAELLESGNDWCDKNAAADLLEQQKHSVLSEIKLSCAENSDAARETWARASNRYRQFLEAMVEARRLSNRARVKYDAVKTLAELRRTEESSRRTEMQFVRQGSAG